MAVLLAARIYNFVSRSLDLHSLHAFFWSDSLIVLSWITNPPRDVFVRNRVSEIQKLTPTQNWDNVEGNQNPADIPSRVVSVSVLPGCDIRFHGPNFLRTVSCQSLTVSQGSASSEAPPSSFDLERYRYLAQGPS